MDKSILSSIAAKAFAKTDNKKDDGGKALSGYHAEKKAEYAKTAKLKELRLAKEAAEREAKLAANSEAPRKTKARAAAKPSASDAPKARRSISWGR